MSHWPFLSVPRSYGPQGLCACCSCCLNRPAPLCLWLTLMTVQAPPGCPWAKSGLPVTHFAGTLDLCRLKLFVSFLLTINKHLLPSSTSQILKVGDFISFSQCPHKAPPLRGIGGWSSEKLNNLPKVARRWSVRAPLLSLSSQVDSELCEGGCMSGRCCTYPQGWAPRPAELQATAKHWWPKRNSTAVATSTPRVQILVSNTML